MFVAATGDLGVRAPSLPEIADRRAADDPGGLYLRFLGDGEAESSRLSFGALAGQARSVAAWLRKISLPGDRALLAYPAGPDFAIAFLACLYAGVIAVPVDPPRRRDAAALARIAENSGAVLLLAHGSVRDRLPDLGPGWLFTDALEGEPAGSEAFAPPSPDAIAYIQYTSGSTQAPRGAAISHRALAEQLDFYRRRAGAGADALTFVGWMPHTHDFGLVGFLLSALYMGRPYVWMPASAFLRRPMRWIEAISRYRGSYCGAPAFAYDLCAAAAQAGNMALDLSCWQIASLGGDYVTPATLARFEAAFAPAGFRSEAWLPAYGLAESVLCATGRNGAAATSFDAGALREGRAVSAGDVGAIALVSSGTPMAGQRIRIVDPDTGVAVMDGAVGEIWLAGASLADGYWNDPAATAAQFRARIAGEGDDTYLRTGDCGFVHGGELFVTGRLKDMIVVHGRNHAPEDIEQTIQDADPSLRRGAGAVFQSGAEDGARLIAVQEAEREADVAALFAAINQAVTARHGIALDEIRLLRLGTLPRTRTGKIARGAARTGAAAGTLHEHAVWTRSAMFGASPIEAELIAQLRAILPGQPIAVGDNLLALGLESLGVQQLIGWLGRRYGVEPSLDALFETPTVRGIARLVGNTPPRDGAALAVAPASADATLNDVLEALKRLNLLVAEQGRLLAALTGRASPLPPLEPAGPPADHFRLTETQQEIRLLGELRPEAASVFQALMVLEFADAPDEARVRDALRRLIQRHEALRTVFEDDEQRVLAACEPPLQHVVLFESPEAWLAEERRRDFAPDAPPWRATIVETVDGRLLVVAAHHLALDGASIAAFAEEFSALLAEPAVRLTKPVQFRDSAAVRPREIARREHAQWWQEMLGRDLPDWQPARPLPPMHRIRYDSARVPIPVEASVRAALVAQGAARGSTLFQTLFIAYAVLLHRVSRQERVLIGVDAAHRGETDSALLGCCNLLVPVVADFGVPHALKQLPARLLQSLARREYTLSMWARDQRIAVDPARPFKINATINYQRLPERAGGLTPRFDLEAVATDANPFGLTLDIRDTGDALHIDLIHNPKFLSDADAARFARYFRRILDALAEEASPDLLALPLHDAEEGTQLASWGGGQAAPAYLSVLDRFAAQCAATPDAVAIACPDTTLSYAALDTLSDGLAGAIAARVVSGASVALLATRGCHALAAMLAVWKAGCVYVALDAKAPDARLARLCGQAEVALLLHDAGHAAPDPELPALRIDRPYDAPPPSRQTPDASAPAYLLFTSGSTGEAKAALVSHGGMANHLQAKIDMLGLGSEDVVAQTAGHGFDISLWQYLAPIAVGGSVRVLGDAATHDSTALFIEADRAGVTVLQLVPSMLRAGLEQLIRQDGRVPFERLRWLISTGEALAADLCRRWIALYPRVPVINAYGPTECSDDVTHHVAEWAPPPDAAWVPIGRPIRGAVLHVVDARGNPVPPGTPGELLVGGACVGLGYRGDPERSAAAFIPDPFSGVDGAKLYRTGDLVRFGADGALDYLGRIDQQLKIGGVRIEPGEIEAALLQDPALLQAYVTTRPRADGTPALVGYVVMRPGKSVDAGTLKAVARNVLPPALVPSAFVFLDALPLTTNGKIDITALPEPDLRPRPRIPVPPKTPVETALVRIWSDAIGQSGFGVQDDFFDLGGRSLDAGCIARRIEEEFNIKFPMVEIFRTPTVRGIAGFVESRI